MSVTLNTTYIAKFGCRGFEVNGEKFLVVEKKGMSDTGDLEINVPDYHLILCGNLNAGGALRINCISLYVLGVQLSSVKERKVNCSGHILASSGIFISHNNEMLSVKDQIYSASSSKRIELIHGLFKKALDKKDGPLFIETLGEMVENVRDPKYDRDNIQVLRNLEYIGVPLSPPVKSHENDLPLSSASAAAPDA